MTQKLLRAGCVLALLAVCGAAQAQVAGTLGVRAGLTRIEPQTHSGDLSPPAFPHSTVDVGSATRLTGGINYMLTDHWALDLPLTVVPFKHRFYGTGAIDGVGELGQTKVLPITLFAQYRFGEANARFRPYVGLGVTYSRFFKERTTAALTALTGGSPANPTTATLDNKWSLTPQLGFVWNFSERWFVDVAYYKSYLKTSAHLSTGQSISLRLNPDVVAVGVGYRF